MSSNGLKSFGGASVHAHELSKRRVSPTVIQTPTTPATPVAPITPILAAHIFAEGNMMEDLQLAAELGKTLLERNKELEGAIKEQRLILDDKTQEIEYLSKQTAALREVNDSRLRIYEQLEISIQELEKSNQRLTAETSADKKKIKSLSGTVEQLEAKCEELQKSLEDAKAFRLQQQQQKQQQKQQQQQQLDRGRALTRRHFVAEDNSLRRSVSCENTAQAFEDMAAEFYELKVRTGALQSKLSSALRDRDAEVSRREDVEIELACLAQENGVLREQVEVLKEKGTPFKSFEDELTSLDDTTSSKFCRKCMGLAEETGSNLTVQDFTDDIEEMDPSYDNFQGDCALVRLKNGGYAWGSQESLASMGQVVNCVVGSSESSPRTEASEAPHNSLLSELDAQYRILIEKYEALVEAREYRKEDDDPVKDAPRHGSPHNYVDSGVDEVSGPMSLVMTEGPPHDQSVNAALRCQRCTTCSCDLKPSRPKSNLEELSEVETSSSGFSDGESRFVTKFTQTDTYGEFIIYDRDAYDDATTPTAAANPKYLDLHTPMNPCEIRFQTRPEYRKLFHEIFEVLKKEVDKKNQANLSVARLRIHSEGSDRDRKSYEQETETETEGDVSTEVSFRDENEENKNPNARVKRRKERKTSTKEEPKKEKVDEVSKEVDKPVRPDFLDLETSSRGSSRSRKRRRPHKNRLPNNLPPNKQENLTQPKAQKKDVKSSPPQALQDAQASRASGNPVQIASNPEPAPSCTATAAPAPSLNASSEPKPNDVLKQQEAKVYSKEKCGDLSKYQDTKATAKERCEHKSRKNRQQKQRSQPLQNKHLKNVTGKPHASTSGHPKDTWSGKHSAPATETMPSVQVAKLIKFEKSYAEALKTNPKRPS